MTKRGKVEAWRLQQGGNVPSQVRPTYILSTAEPRKPQPIHVDASISTSSHDLNDVVTKHNDAL